MLLKPEIDCLDIHWNADFAIDMDLNIVQAGSALLRLIPEMAFPGVKVNQVLRIHHPCTHWDLGHLLQFDLNTKVVLSSTSGLELRGGLHQMKHTHRDVHSGALVEGPNDIIL